MGRRIGLVVPALDESQGVASVAAFILRALQELTDYEIRLVSLAMSARDACSVRLLSPASWLRGLRSREGVFHDTPFTHVGAQVSEIETQRYSPRAKLAQLLGDCDAIQVVAGFPAWARPVLGLGVPVSLQVATLVGVERAHHAGGGPLKHWRRFMTNRVSGIETPVLRAVDAVQVENGWMLDHVRKVTEGHDTSVRFAAPGVDTSLFHPATDGPARPGYILAVGRMADPRKNHMLLLEAYSALAARIDSPPRLALAGPDAPTSEFLAEVARRELGTQIDVHTFPARDALASLFREATAYVSTSDEEGFGMTVIEAMASGTPAVATRSGGPQDIIDDGTDGFLADVGDADVLADRLQRLVADPELRTSMGTAARAKVLSRYDRDIAAKAFVEVIEELSAQKRKQNLP